ncbi:MAG: HD-GYP domain-containing protein [Cohnella sp.]|nr:HD-GYP domain-containing protein [Cohnella sp.]
MTVSDTGLISRLHRDFIMQERSYLKAIRELRQAKTGFMDQVLENQKLVEGTLVALTNALEAKDPYTLGHSHRVSRFAEGIALSLGLSPKQCETIRLAALFHDIGKIGIPDSILGKKGPLTEEEFAQVRRHPELSVKIVESVDPFHLLLPAIRHHHENWDGSGYPDGLRENQIPIGACIIRVADSFDAMTSNRPYRADDSPRSAVTEIKAKSGTWFHPDIVNQFEIYCQSTSLVSIRT